MKKEQLTEENIKSDIQKRIKDAFVQLLIDLSVYLLILVSVCICKSNLPPFYYIFLFMSILIFISNVLIVVDIVKWYIVLKNDIIIVNDVLVDKKEEFIWGGTNRSAFYKLCFYTHATYTLPLKNYLWSDNCCMSDERIYELSDCGDGFYLVVFNKNKQKPLLVYNKRFFEFKEN